MSHSAAQSALQCGLDIELIIQHSGGEEVLLDVGGQDATEAFEDVGHSDEAREILDGLLVGNLKRMVRPLFTTYSINLHTKVLV